MDEFEDDFGDLYADVEVQASSAINAAVVQVDDDVVKKVVGGSGSGDGDGSGKEDEVGVDDDGGGGIDEYGSDSEDDLKIVLNSDDDDGGGTGVPVTALRSVNLVENEDEEDMERDGLGGEGNGVNDKAENGVCGERGKGGYHSQHSHYKYVRSHSAVSGNRAKENGCAALSSYSYSSLRADREDNGCGKQVRSGSAVAQSGNNFSLPRSRTIVDVNIDIFERKPWRHPGADVTDFFNYGFDEESWKRFCNQLDEYRHRAAIPTRVPPFESFKSSEAYEVDDETVAHKGKGKSRSRQGRTVTSALSCDEQSEMQMGRAIQVEDSIIERKPSMDIRRQLDRDSDVIQINVQESMENSCGTENRSLPEVSDNEDNGVDESGEFLSFSTASEDELNSESLDGHPEEMDIPVSKRSMNSNGSLQISDMCGHQNLIVAACGSERADGGTGTENTTKDRARGDAYTKNSSIVESKLWQREKTQHSRRSSSSVSHSEAIEHSPYIGMRKSYFQIKRRSTNSFSETRNSVRSERYDVKRKQAYPRYCERQRSPAHPNKRIHVVAKSKTQFDKDNICFFDDEGHYNMRLSTIDRTKAKERLPAVDSYYKGKYLSDQECEHPFDIYNERYSDNEFRGDRKGLHRKGFREFGAYEDRYMFKSSNERGDFLEEEFSMLDEEITEMDWYQYERRQDVEDAGPLSNQELEQLNFEYSSYLDDERDGPWDRKGDKLHFSRREKNDGVFLGRDYSNDMQEGKHKRSFEYHDSYDKHIPYSRRENRNSERNRSFGSPSVGLDNYWSSDDGDGFLRFKDDPYFSSHYPKESQFSSNKRFCGSKMPRNSACHRQGKDRREWSERFRDVGPFGAYYDDIDAEESINNINDDGHVGRKRHFSKAERLQWNKGQSMLRPTSHEFHTEGARFAYLRTSRRKKFNDLHDSDHVGELIDDMHANGGGRYKQTRESDKLYQFDRTRKIIQSREQMFVSCEDSIVSDLVVVEEKYSGRYPDRLEKKDLNVESEQKTQKEYDESAHVDKPEVETNQNDEKWLDKFPVTQDNEAFDIEEGQIIAEEKNKGQLDNNICVPKTEVPRSEGNKFLNQNRRNDGKSVVEGYDNNPRILEVMAKMEKRRERFKEPICASKDGDNNDIVTNKNLVDGTSSTAKFQRPARKRRWAT